MFVGYSSLHTGYRCLYPLIGKVYITRHAIFDEETFPFKDQFKHLIPRYDTSLLKAWQAATVFKNVVEEEEQVTRFLSPPQPPIQSLPEPAVVDDHAVVNDDHQQNHHMQQHLVEPHLPPEPVPNLHPMQTRAKAGIHKPNTRYALLAPN